MYLLGVCLFRMAFAIDVGCLNRVTMPVRMEDVMIEVSMRVEGQTDLTWPHWKRWVAMAERHGFAGLYRSDHFTMTVPPAQDSLETIVSLA